MRAYFWLAVCLVFEEVSCQILGPVPNIRHGKSRARLFRGGRKEEEDYATQPAADPSLTTRLTLTSVENPINFDNLSYVSSEQLKSVGDSGNATAAGKKSRKVTVDANFSATTNSSWQHMDKSVMYIGERALNQFGNKKKNKNKPKTGKAAIDVASEDSLLEEDLEEDEEDPDFQKDPHKTGHVDIVTRFLRIVESQHLLGENCTAGTDLNLGEGVVDRYAQERFRVEADVAVNRANMLTRLWKYADPSVMNSEYLLHASVFSMVEFDDDIFAAGNCYDQYQYKDYWLFCPYAYRLPEGTILVKDLAVEYKYLSNTSEWFYIARKNAENVIRNYNQFSRGKIIFLSPVFCVQD